jgi:hypothetical protein
MLPAFGSVCPHASALPHDITATIVRSFFMFVF